jgi:hypothetical protein
MSASSATLGDRISISRCRHGYDLLLLRPSYHRIDHHASCIARPSSSMTATPKKEDKASNDLWLVDNSALAIDQQH